MTMVSCVSELKGKKIKSAEMVGDGFEIVIKFECGDAAVLSSSDGYGDRDLRFRVDLTYNDRVEFGLLTKDELEIAKKDKASRELFDKLTREQLELMGLE